MALQPEHKAFQALTVTKSIFLKFDVIALRELRQTIIRERIVQLSNPLIEHGT